MGILNKSKAWEHNFIDGYNHKQQQIRMFGGMYVFM